MCFGENCIKRLGPLVRLVDWDVGNYKVTNDADAQKLGRVAQVLLDLQQQGYPILLY